MNVRRGKRARLLRRRQRQLQLRAGAEGRGGHPHLHRRRRRQPVEDREEDLRQREPLEGDLEANKDQIKNPDLIHPGQILKIPGA